jgi:hypothetical protein
VPEGQIPGRYLRTVQAQRGDYRDRITVRRSDVTAVATLIG